MTVESRELPRGARPARPKRVAGRDKPPAWLQYAEHLLQAGGDISHVMQRGVAADEIEGSRHERQGVRQCAHPAGLRNDTGAATDEHRVVLDGGDVRPGGDETIAVVSRAGAD